MWEITLFGKPCDIAFLIELKDYLKKHLEKDIIVVIAFDKNLICSIAISNLSHKKFVINAIYECMLKIVKSEFYHDNLRILGSDKSLNSFILSSILLINLNEEKKYAMEVTRLSKNVHIRPFIYFKLHNMLDLWQREVDYYNRHFSGLLQDSLYLEFLRFLAQNNNSNSEIIYIEDNKKEMLLLDKKKNTIKTISKSDEIGIIVNLIMYAPSKVIINCIDSLSKKVSSLISYIFEDRVSILL